MSVSEKRKFLYFYSSRCKFCSQFTEMLERSNEVKNNFISISIDNPSIRLPPYLEVVPTIQIYDGGGRRHILSDKHAFEWLNQYSQKPVETEPFCIGEMGSSLSDCFSFLDGQDDKMVGSDKAYASLEQLDNFYITTPNEGNGNKSGSSNSSSGAKLENLDKLTSDMQKLEQLRNKELPQRGGPAPKVPDFKQPLGGSLVGRTNEFGTVSMGKEKEEQSQKFQRQYDLIIQQRNADVPRRKIPTTAPNFESPNYKSEFVTNEMMKKAYQPQQNNMNVNYQNVVPTIPKPKENPNFGVSAYFDSKINNSQSQQHSQNMRPIPRQLQRHLPQQHSQQHPQQHPQQQRQQQSQHLQQISRQQLNHPRQHLNSHQLPYKRI